MQQVSSQELDRRINTFLTKKHQEFPELELRPQEADRKVAPSVADMFADLIAGAKWEFGR